MIATRISRKKLYKREYNRDTLLIKDETINDEIITENLGKIITIMLNEKGVK